ncbi:MAG: helix-turn-helix domain-containing protein [Coriobacteriia bacterium]|nr:helix-turn-helix domain-containing protein [Coriobacteriia bacterium]
MVTEAIPLLDSLPDLMTVHEAALVLRRCDSSVYAATRSGEIPAVRLGRRTVIPKAAIVRLIGEAS